MERIFLIFPWKIEYLLTIFVRQAVGLLIPEVPIGITVDYVPVQNGKIGMSEITIAYFGTFGPTGLARKIRRVHHHALDGWKIWTLIDRFIITRTKNDH
jgi:hypothetical protein